MPLYRYTLKESMEPLKTLKRSIRWAKARSVNLFADARLRRICAHYDFRGYKRIYLVHIRKTGGTSLNNMFLSLTGSGSTELYNKLALSTPHRIVDNGLVFVGWDVAAINRGLYFYAFSHTPIHELNLPEDTFTVSCFRDPVKRLVSHYNMLMDFKLNNVNHPCMEIEGEWLGNSFGNFLERIPREHLQNQLYMYSRAFDIGEAISKVNQLSHWFFGDSFADGVAEFNQKTGLSLHPIHIRKSGQHISLSGAEDALLREALSEELAFIGELRKQKRITLA